ncbi:DoxX family membrane protein [Xanthocytophaga flava]|uniref:DoxX family membrane protein n=1 Tax=Xanthocytophaga flava TaxID=3048013 RepID=UPI0028D0012E|nr:DoxX family membrane protein [Xanthocytophaga flavus]MDJ1472418.1 DoxX family membrane protein [Xanthocytophaga flavus]
MNTYQNIAGFLVRIALASGFLSAVASRLSLWGTNSSGWSAFVTYTAKVNSFVPERLALFLAIISTIVEVVLGLLLLIGFKTRWAAFGAAVLSLLFALAMTYSYTIKEPLDYSVFAFSMGAFLLSTLPVHKWSIDSLFT